MKTATPFLPIAALCLLLCLPASGAEAVKTDYRGWKAIALKNGLIEVHVVSSIGGRVMQFKLGDAEFLWVNPQLAGKEPPPTGLGPKGEWLNYGGDKLWPAPQGWDNDQQWPGPPDAVLDGSPHQSAIMDSEGNAAGVYLKSGEDKRSGIQFTRAIRIADDSSRVAFTATMTNVDTRPRRWGIWSHTQLDGANRSGPGHNPKLVSYCPLNPKSHFPKGYSVIFGAEDNPSFQPDAARKMMRVQYQYKVGKIGLDSSAGWIATVDGSKGAVFVQRFSFEPGQEYPDGSSVEYWCNGLGSFRAWGKENVMKDDPKENPHVFEAEMLSPLARLNPRQTYRWQYDWFACRVGGDYPVADCSPFGVTCEPLRAEVQGGKVRLSGRFGVFQAGKVEVVFFDKAGRACGRSELGAVSPREAIVLSSSLPLPAEAASLRVHCFNNADKLLCELGSARIEP